MCQNEREQAKSRFEEQKEKTIAKFVKFPGATHLGQGAAHTT